MVVQCCRSPNHGTRGHLMLAVSFLLFNTISVVLSSSASMGREFIFAFPTTPSGDEAHLTLTITAFEAGQTDVNVSIVNFDWSRVLTISAQHSTVAVALPPEAEAIGSGLHNTTVLVAASRNVSVFALAEDEESAGGFLARSAGSLGTDYFVVSYTPVVGDWSEFTVSATEDDTVIHIQLQAPLVFDNAPYGREELQFSLARLQTAQFQSAQDLTGSRIRANRPVSVVSGSSASNVPAEFGSPGHVLEHLPPVGAWGTVHALSPLPGRTSGYRCKVVASCSMTMVRGFGDRVILASAGDSFEWDGQADSVAVIKSSAPVLVAQFSKGKQADESLGSEPGIGGPALLITQPIDLTVAGAGALLSTPALPAEAYHDVSVTIRCNETYGLTLNDSPLAPDREYEYMYTELEGICTVHKRLEAADSNSTIFVNHSASARVPFAVSVVAHGTGFAGAYALSASLDGDVSHCESTGPDGCCFMEDSQFASLSYDEEGSMGSSDYDAYNSVRDLLVDHKAADDGLMLHPQNQTTVMQNTLENNTTSATDATQSAAVTQDLQTPSITEDSNSASGFVTSKTTETSTGQQAISPATSNIPTNRQEASTYTDPSESTDSSVSAASPAIRSESSTEAGTTADRSSVVMKVSTTTGSTQATWLDSTVVLTRGSASAGLSTDSTLSTLIDSTPSTSAADTPTSSPANPTLSTWLAAALTSTPKQPTTEMKVETICSTCEAPFQILLYGGISMATLLLLTIFACLVKIIHSRHSARTVQMKRNSRWVAFPATLSSDELNLSRLNLKPPADAPTSEPKPGPTGTDDVPNTGENESKTAKPELADEEK